MTGNRLATLGSRGAKIVTGRPRCNRPTPFFLSSAGITLIEIIAVLMIIFVLIILVTYSLKAYQKKAHDIAAQRDLKNFASIVTAGKELQYDIDLGRPTQKLCHDGSRVDFTLPDFTLSEGVCITILSGDPGRLYDNNNPYIASSRYKDSTTIYDYNFATSRFSDREASKDGTH